jgi:hypothetical protein
MLHQLLTAVKLSPNPKMQWIFFLRAFIQLLSQAGSPEKQRE